MNVDRIRELLLERAIQGKLVPQLDSEPAVKQIGKAPDEVPFEIPEKWKWETLGAVIDYGKAKQIAGAEIEPDDWVLDLEDIEKETGVLLRKKRNVETTSNKAVFKAGNVLYGKLRPYLNKVIIADEDGYCTTEIVVLDVETARAQIDAGFLQIYLMSPLFVQYANSKSYGVKMPRLGTKDANAAVFPLPPLAEQRRIVARLNELLPLVDSYEKNEADLERLSQLLKSAVLQKAIEGKLVPQLDSEPAVEQIGKAPEEVPFEIPEKWKWCRLSDLGKVVGGGTPKTNIAEYWDGEIRWFTPADLGKLKGIYASESSRKITALGLKESSAQLMAEDTMLFSSRAPIGHIAIATTQCCTNQGCKSLVPNKDRIIPAWGFLVMKARTADMVARASGTTSKEISGRGVAETLTPLPPLPEQRRIVAHIKELFALIDNMKSSVHE